MKNKSASFKVFVSNKDIQTFAKLTGDLNPLHIDPEYAATTNFKGQIAAIAEYPDQLETLKENGVDAAFNIYSEAGSGFARHVCEQLNPNISKI